MKIKTKILSWTSIFFIEVHEKKNLALWLADERRIFSAELHALQVKLYCIGMSLEQVIMFCFVSTLQKRKAILKSLCGMQMSQKLFEKSKFSCDECLP